MSPPRRRWRVFYALQGTTNMYADIDSEEIVGAEPTAEEAQHAVDEDVRINVVGITDRIEEL